MRLNPFASGFALLFHLLLCSNASPINAPMLDVYDYIVVGGGASGLTVANRLTENPNINVLVLEAGPADHYEDFILIPVQVGKDIISQYNWNLSSVPQIYLDGRTRSIPQGRGLGGGTLINAMLWNRGGQGDYNDWATLGNPGWDWNSMLPYFMKSETFTNDVSEENANQFYIHPDPSLHGTTGPVNVTYSKYFYNSSNLFFDGLAYLGVPIAGDPNEGSIAGAYFLPMDLDPNNMTRSDARLSYYEPFSLRPNFHVQVGKHVTRVLFDNSSCDTSKTGLRAIGVEYTTSSTSPRLSVYAKREVIMAAGSLHTPQILELSGLGQPSVLSKYGITTLLNLPGLGNNLQDHYLTGFNWPYQNKAYITPNWLATNVTFAAAAEEEYYLSRTGPWTAGPPNGVAFPSLPDISPNNSANIVADAAAQTPGQYLPDGLDATVLAGYQAMHALMVAALGDRSRAAYELLNSNTGYFTQSIMRPFSRGTTHIVSSNPFTPPAIDPRYCSNPVDMAILLETYKFQFRLMSTPSMQKINPGQWIPYSSDSDAQIVNLIKAITQTEFHVSGSCAMLPLELGGVVDPTALVYGTQNLRIVDASIQPLTPAAHLQAVVYGVAEKCADLIKAAPAYTSIPSIVLPPPAVTTQCSVTSDSSISSSSTSISISSSIISPPLDSTTSIPFVLFTSATINLSTLSSNSGSVETTASMSAVVSNDPASTPNTSVTSDVATSATSDVITSATSDVTTSVTSNITTSVTSDLTTSATSEVLSSATSNIISSATSDVISSATSNVTSSATSDVTSSATSDVTSSATSDVISLATSDITLSMTSAVTTSTISSKKSRTKSKSKTSSTTRTNDVSTVATSSHSKKPKTKTITITFTTVQTTIYTTAWLFTTTFYDTMRGNTCTSVYTTTSILTSLIKSTYTSITTKTIHPITGQSTSTSLPGYEITTTTETATLTTSYPVTTILTNSEGETSENSDSAASIYTSVFAATYSTTNSATTTTPGMMANGGKAGEAYRSVTPPVAIKNNYDNINENNNYNIATTITVKTTHYTTICDACTISTTPASAPPFYSSAPPPSSLGLLPAIVMTPELSPTMGFPLGPPVLTGVGSVKPQWSSWASSAEF